MANKKVKKKPVLKEIYGDSQHFKKKSTTLSTKYLNKEKITQEFLDVLGTLSIEEILTLKLEQVARLYGGKFYGFSLYHSIPNITKEALFKYAAFCTNSRKEASMVLGVDKRYYGQLEAKFKKTMKLFKDNDE